jgi:hypothetical protein
VAGYPAESRTACWPVREQRRRRGDEVLVVEERATERRLEEPVGDHVVGSAVRVQVLVERQLGGVVVAHRHADRVAARDVAVLVPAVQLVLLLVEPVHQVARAPAGKTAPVQDPVREAEKVVEVRAGRGRGRNERVDVVRGIGEGALIGGLAAIAQRDRLRAAGRGERRRGREVDVQLLQALVRRTVLSDLPRVGGVRVGQADDGWPSTRPHNRTSCRSCGSPRRSPRGA